MDQFDGYLKGGFEYLLDTGVINSVPTKLAQEVAREDAVSTIVSRSDSYSMSVWESWDEQRQAEAMMSHNIARDFNNDMKKAAAQINAQFLIVVGEDGRVVTPQPAQEFAESIGVTVLELDEDCGHGDPWCAQDAFANAVSTFLN